MKRKIDRSMDGTLTVSGDEERPNGVMAEFHGGSRDKERRRLENPFDTPVSELPEQLRAPCEILTNDHERYRLTDVLTPGNGRVEDLYVYHWVGYGVIPNEEKN